MWNTPMTGSTHYVTVDMAERSFAHKEFIGIVKEILSRGKAIRFRARGSSMWPFIRNGDVITLSPVLDTTDQGDVVAFESQQSNKLIVHRVIRTTGHGLLLKGDNLCQSDDQVDRAHILGKVIRVERKGADKRFGLGRERLFIALLSRLGCLTPVLGVVRKIRFLSSKWRG